MSRINNTINKFKATYRLNDILFENKWIVLLMPIPFIASWFHLFVKLWKSFAKGMRQSSDFTGRTTRAEFLWFVLSVCAVGAIAFFCPLLIMFCFDMSKATRINLEIARPIPINLEMALVFLIYLIFLAIVAFVLIKPLVSCAVRRCHDVGKRGRYAFLPIFNIIYFLSPSLLLSEVNADGSRVLVITKNPVIGDVNDEYCQHGPSCSIKSQQIILNEYGVNVSEVELEEYASDHGLYYSESNENARPTWEGTGNLIELYKIPIRRYSHATINDLMGELTLGHMVIAGVEFEELYKDRWLRELNEIIYPDHVIIVNGIDVSDPNNEVAYITDSALGIHNYDCPLDSFLDAWQDSAGFMVATQIPIPSWNFSPELKPYKFDLDVYPYNLVKPEAFDEEEREKWFSSDTFRRIASYRPDYRKMALDLKAARRRKNR